ncbi:MAG TPA: L,D-transpeptidase [Thermoanaerobaculia bacterium]|nr:L,D-transpeptidase [Thermoanaerobaculia bacterium]
MSLFKPDRRSSPRSESSDRRGFPRPPLWLNLAILAIAIAGLAMAQFHRKSLTRQYEDVLTEKLRTPEEVNRLKDELAKRNLSKEQLARELEAQKEFLQGLDSNEFYLSVDTSAKKLRFHYGGAILRETDVVIGPEAVIKGPDKSWTFVPIKGAFDIEGKVAGHSWTIPEWIYLMKNEPVPASRPTIEGGLGKYVIQLPNGYVIHSPPVEESPLDGPKPGSIMVTTDADLRAIWPRIHKGTSVYIF